MSSSWEHWYRRLVYEYKHVFTIQLQNSEMFEKYATAFGVSFEDMKYYNGSGSGEQFSLQILMNTNTLFVRTPFRARNEAEEAYNYVALNEFINPFAVHYKKIKVHPNEALQVMLSNFTLFSDS